MATPTLTRRTVLNTAALATTALAMPFVHGAYAAGKLSCGFCTLYNYPPRGNVTALLAGYPAPTSLGAQMFAQGTICHAYVRRRDLSSRVLPQP